MENLLAVLLIVGCTADARTCAEIEVPTPFYASVSDCNDDMQLQMRMAPTFDARVLGSCVGVEETMLEQSGALEWAVTRGGDLVARFVPDDTDAIAALSPADGADEAVRLASR